MSGSLVISGQKFVAFDIGNVLCHVDIDGFFDFLVNRNVIKTKEQAEEFVSGIQYPQDLGLYNIKQGFYRFSPDITSSALKDLHDAWLHIVEPSDEMLGVLDDTLSQGYQVALLSNIGFDHAGVVRQICPVFKSCYQHFSCEIGARKPTKLFYQSFVMHYGWPQGVVFFDDRCENVEAARPYFNGIQFDLDLFPNDEDAARSVRELLELK